MPFWQWRPGYRERLFPIRAYVKRVANWYKSNADKHLLLWIKAMLSARLSGTSTKDATLSQQKLLTDIFSEKVSFYHLIAREHFLSK